ncbi:PilW family protein [Trichothermofontia sp.]
MTTHRWHRHLRLLLLMQRSPHTATSKGFTVTELLIGAFIGFMALSGLLYLMTQVLQTEQRDVARAETQREMALALNFIREELQEAIYVYPGGCLNTLGSDCLARTTTLDSEVSLPAGNIPVLAFWKQEALPYTTADPLPSAACNTVPSSVQGECVSANVARNAMTLVIYTLRRNNDGTQWQGPARLIRYQLRKYASLSTPTAFATNYANDPSDPNFLTWRCQNGTSASGCSLANNGHVLIDSVDFSPTTTALTNACPGDYNLSPLTPAINAANGSDSFYACIAKPPLQETSLNFMQDVQVFLRGNAVARAGLPTNSRPPSYLPRVETRVQLRSAFRRTPPNFTN